MLRSWKLKALVAVAAIALLLFGFNEMHADPTLRALKTVAMAELEAAPTARDGQYLAVNDGYLMPFYMVKTSKGKRGSSHAHVYAALGTQAMQRQAFEQQPVKPALWVRLPTDYREAAAAEAAMSADAPYQTPFPISGLVETLASGVRDEMVKNKDVQIDTPVYLEDGSTPLSYGGGAGLAAAGALLVVVLALWSVADWQSAGWLDGLKRPGVDVYQGKTATLMAALVGVPMFVGFGGEMVREAFEDRTIAAVPLVLALVGLGLTVWGLWRSRGAVTIGADTIEVVRNRRVTAVPLGEVSGLVVDERRVKGVLVATYTLHGPAKPVKLGTSWFNGGVDDAKSFGVALRDAVASRVGPAIEQRIARGEVVPFGPLSMSVAGLLKGKGGDVLPWEEVASAALAKGKLKVKQKGKMLAWGGFAASKIVNVDVLMHLLSRKGL